MFIVMFISKDSDQAMEVLDVWIKSGIEGVTILESAGLSEVASGFRDDVGLVFSIASLMRLKEIHHRTLLSAAKDQATVDRVVQATTAYVGDWSQPDVGVLFVWPLVAAYGLEKQFSTEKKKK
jgi:hypothetical protein